MVYYIDDYSVNNIIVNMDIMLIELVYVVNGVEYWLVFMNLVDIGIIFK